MRQKNNVDELWTTTKPKKRFCNLLARLEIRDHRQKPIFSGDENRG